MVQHLILPILGVNPGETFPGVSPFRVNTNPEYISQIKFIAVCIFADFKGEQFSKNLKIMEISLVFG